jgi:hypothetical protein
MLNEMFNDSIDLIMNEMEYELLGILASPLSISTFIQNFATAFIQSPSIMNLIKKRLDEDKTINQETKKEIEQLIEKVNKIKITPALDVWRD